MKRTFLPLIILAAMLITGCNGNKKTAPVAAFVDTKEDVADSTVYGRCGESTAMHTLELITDKGDTLSYLLEGTDTCANVQGGLFVGDRLAVIGNREADGSLVAAKVINLTSLLGKWVSIDRNFEIREGGIIVSNVKEPKPYTDWKILNGHLVMSADTFDVYSLGPDSLYLENADGIYGYKRLSKEAEGQESD